MRTTSLIAVAVVLAGSSIPFLSAQGSPASSISFEVYSPLPDKGSITLLDPSQEDKVLPSAPYVLSNPIPGDHTVFATSPAGTIAEIKVYNGEHLIASEPVPQVSFPVGINDHIKVIITYTLTAYGTIGISTDPGGIPFVLTGPANITEEGVTPITLERMPIGAYGVKFYPKGCNNPPPQGNELANAQKIYFTLSIKCDTFEPTRDRSKEIDAGALTFIDIQTADWFAPYAFQMAHLGVLTGYKDENGNPTGRFGPSDAVTIAQLSKVVHVFMGLPPSQALPELLEHPAAAGTWYQGYARSAEERDWRIFMDPALDFNRNATRGEILVTLLQVLDIPLQWAHGDIFRDVNRRTPYASAIETAQKLGIVVGKTDADGKPTGSFGPNDGVNRAELSKMLSILMEKYRSKSSSSSSK